MTHRVTELCERVLPGWRWGGGSLSGCTTDLGAHYNCLSGFREGVPRAVVALSHL